MTSRVLITGTKSGFGQALAYEFDHSGLDVVGMNRSLDDSVTSIHCDLRLEQSVSDAMVMLSKLMPEMDYVVLNAGVLGPIGTARHVSFQDISMAVRVNALSSVQILQALLLGNFRGTVIIISSGAALNPYPDLFAYSLSKSLQLHQAAAFQRIQDQFDVVAVNPGPMRTSMNSALVDAYSSGAFPSFEKFADGQNVEEPSTRAHQLVRHISEFSRTSVPDLIDLRQYPGQEGRA